MRKGCLLVIIFFSVIFFYSTNIPAEEKTKGLLQNKSAIARASMGIFSNPFNRYLSKNVFHLNPNSLLSQFTSLMIAAAGYQTLSYDEMDGVKIDPFVFKKSWKGYWTGYLAGGGANIFLNAIKKSKHADKIIAAAFFTTMLAITIDGEIGDTWRVADDSPLNFDNLFMNRDHYWTHFAGTGGLYWILSNHTKTPSQALLFTVVLVFWWEYKDGYIRTDSKYGYLGGDGFSLSDATAGVIAASGSYLFDKFILSIFKDSSVENRHSLSISPNFYSPGLTIKLHF